VFSSRRRHTRSKRDWSSDVCSSDLNGAGKTTASYTVLPEILECREFVNADEIAKGLSPFNPSSVAIEAGRLMLKRIGELLSAGEIGRASCRGRGELWGREGSGGEER